MKKKIICLCVIVATLCMINGCGGIPIYESHKNGYTDVTSVEGVSFDITSSLLNQATAITAISEDEDYTGSTYVYKNGDGVYLLFNMDAIVVAVAKGTDFNFNDSDKEEALTSKSLNGIWLEKDGNKINYEESTKNSSYKIVVKANADVSITQDIYGSFAGEVASIKKGGVEYTMFVGANADNYDSLTSNQKSIIEHIAGSLTIPGKVSSDESVEPGTEKNNEVVISEVNEDTEISDTESIENADNTENNTEEPTDEVVIEPSTEPSTEDKVVVSPEDSSVSDSVKDEASTDNTEAEIVEPEIAVPPATEEPATEITTETPATEEPTETYEKSTEKTTVSASNNQKAVVGKTSDIYHMLALGQLGELMALGNDGKSMDTEDITITNLYTGDEAVNIIKAYCKTKACPYKYKAATEGTSWHVVEYIIEKSPDMLYADIRIKGLDGEKLRYRGVPHTSRTHDIFYYAEHTAEGYAKMYCYYEVPNGCKEYMLECGTKNEVDKKSSTTACYLINNY